MTPTIPEPSAPRVISDVARLSHVAGWPPGAGHPLPTVTEWRIHA